MSSPIHNSLPLRPLILFNLALAVPVYFAYLNVTDVLISKAFIYGYLLCSANLWALIGVGGLIVPAVALNQGKVKLLTGIGAILTGLKFLAVMAAFFLAVTILELPAFHLMIGALVAIVSSATFVSIGFMRYLKKVAAKREQEHRMIVDERNLKASNS
ncbi:MAG: hypothetical protein HRU19_19585 [Pseudobacteriovorax sp.]|nr:hypothetical protein [Pseudobacteriovorax sp.]